MVETPKLDALASFVGTFGRFVELNPNLTPEYKQHLLLEALLEIREILKTVRQKSLP